MVPEPIPANEIPFSSSPDDPGTFDPDNVFSVGTDKIAGKLIFNVIATGETNTVKDFCRHAFEHVDLNWEDHVQVDPKFFRPADVNALCGNPAKADRLLDWQPEVSFPELVAMMVDADLDRVERELEGIVRG